MLVPALYGQVNRSNASFVLMQDVGEDCENPEFGSPKNDDEGWRVVGSLIKELHSVTAPLFVDNVELIEGWFSVYKQRLEGQLSKVEFEGILEDVCVRISDALERTSCLVELNHPVELVLAHNDAHPGNVVGSTDHFWLIDFEYAQKSDRSLDLIQIKCQSGIYWPAFCDEYTPMPECSDNVLRLYSLKYMANIVTYWEHLLRSGVISYTRKNRSQLKEAFLSIMNPDDILRGIGNREDSEIWARIALSLAKVHYDLNNSLSALPWLQLCMSMGASSDIQLECAKLYRRLDIRHEERMNFDLIS